MATTSDPSKYEKQNVHDPYDVICDDFDRTRGYLWKGATIFFESITQYSTVLEVGSGNGRNLYGIQKRVDNPVLMACDFSEKFCKLTLSHKIESTVADNIMLPFRSNLFDYVMSIAVVHHFSTPDRRKRAISELIRVLSPGGQLFIQVWAFEQPKESKRHFKTQDELVSWHLDKRRNKDGVTKIITRYYHLFVEGELEELINSIPGIKITKSFYEMGNWACIVAKNN